LDDGAAIYGARQRPLSLELGEKALEVDLEAKRPGDGA
jgi:hypothetical protein